MLVSVALRNSTRYFSPTSGSTRLIVTFMPSARFGSMLMPRKSSQNPVGMERITSALPVLGAVPVGMPERSS